MTYVNNIFQRLPFKGRKDRGELLPNSRLKNKIKNGIKFSFQILEKNSKKTFQYIFLASSKDFKSEIPIFWIN